MNFLAFHSVKFPKNLQMSKKHFTFVGTRLFWEIYLISFPQGEETKFTKIEKTTNRNPTFWIWIWIFWIRFAEKVLEDDSRKLQIVL